MLDDETARRIEERLEDLQRDVSLLVKNLPLLEEALTKQEIKEEHMRKQAKIKASASRFLHKQKKGSE